MISFSILATAALWQLAAADFTSAGQLFQLAGQSGVNNAKLSWSTISGASTYAVEQREGADGRFVTIGSTSGDSYDVYGLTAGTSYNWRITAKAGQQDLDQSGLTTLTPFEPSGSYNTYDNTVPSTALVKDDLASNGTYYKYNYETFPNGSFSQLTQQTSTDGYTFTGNKTVLENTVLCASANYSCKLERIQFRKHPDGQFVMWAHFERSQDYSLGEVAVAHCVPGETLTFDGAFQPLGHDSRDMTFFADGDEAWLISSTNTNTDMNIYALTANWTAVANLTVTVNKAAYREAPAVIKSNGQYYLFTSRAAGWLPSQPQYITAPSMAGPWSAAVDIGNTATFCSQSGSVLQLASGQFFMLGDRWSANWPIPSGPTRQLALPISLSQTGGFANYHFYPTVKYSDQITTSGQGIYGVQSGKILSIGKSSTSDAGLQNITLANDGTSDTPGLYFEPSTVPFWYQIDLGNSSKISRIDLTTNMVQGSETFYGFNVTGSSDNSTFTLLSSASSNKDVGFVSVVADSETAVRYVRVEVDTVRNAHNGNEADFAKGVAEVTIYGAWTLRTSRHHRIYERCRSCRVS